MIQHGDTCIGQFNFPRDEPFKGSQCEIKCPPEQAKWSPGKERKIHLVSIVVHDFKSRTTGVGESPYVDKRHRWPLVFS